MSGALEPIESGGRGARSRAIEGRSKGDRRAIEGRSSHLDHALPDEDTLDKLRQLVDTLGGSPRRYADPLDRSIAAGQRAGNKTNQPLTYDRVIVGGSTEHTGHPDARATRSNTSSSCRRCVSG